MYKNTTDRVSAVRQTKARKSENLEKIVFFFFQRERNDDEPHQKRKANAFLINGKKKKKKKKFAQLRMVAIR